MGASSLRVDLPDKVTGRAEYTTDLRLPGMLYARVLRPGTLRVGDAVRIAG